MYMPGYVLEGGRAKSVEMVEYSRDDTKTKINIKKERKKEVGTILDGRKGGVVCIEGLRSLFRDEGPGGRGSSRIKAAARRAHSCGGLERATSIYMYIP